LIKSISVKVLMNRLLVDTNVLIYAIDEDSVYFKKSRKIFFDENVSLFTTSKNISEFLTVITRHPENGLTLYEAMKVIYEYSRFIQILYPTEITYRIFLKLLETYQPIGLKIHDFEIVSIGLANGINRIATFNQKDFKEIKDISFYPQ